MSIERLSELSNRPCTPDELAELQAAGYMIADTVHGLGPMFVAGEDWPAERCSHLLGENDPRLDAIPVTAPDDASKAGAR